MRTTRIRSWFVGLLSQYAAPAAAEYRGPGAARDCRHSHGQVSLCADGCLCCVPCAMCAIQQLRCLLTSGLLASIPAHHVWPYCRPGLILELLQQYQQLVDCLMASARSRSSEQAIKPALQQLLSLDEKASAHQDPTVRARWRRLLFPCGAPAHPHPLLFHNQVRCAQQRRQASQPPDSCLCGSLGGLGVWGLTKGRQNLDLLCSCLLAALDWSRLTASHLCARPQASQTLLHVLAASGDELGISRLQLSCKLLKLEDVWVEAQRQQDRVGWGAQQPVGGAETPAH